MALFVKRQGVKQVPWFSLTEWHQVYKQVYSNDTIEQTKAYEMLLVWKARMPKLPIGVDCTLSILQVCLRDREWTPKINDGLLPISYENDLCLMYSITIMRFLNQVSNVGYTKQTSLFQIAEQLNIPDWIVNLRHDTAHGHELPSIGVLRIAINILLTWLHEEYWAVEAQLVEQYHTNDVTMTEKQETEEVQVFSDLIDLWSAVSLYIHAGCQLVSDIPDPDLKESLQDLRTFAIDLSQQNDDNDSEDKDNSTESAKSELKKDKKYRLESAQMILISEISRYLKRKSVPNKEDVVFGALFNTEAFLPSSDTLLIFTKAKNSAYESDFLPLDMITFWKDVIFLLHEKGMLESLILRLLRLVEKVDEDNQKRLLAALWINSLSHSFLKLEAAQRMTQSKEYQLEIGNKKSLPKARINQINRKIESTQPSLKHVLSFDIACTVPSCLMDINFASRLMKNINKFSVKFVAPILDLVSPKIQEERKRLLLDLASLYASEKLDIDRNTSTRTSKKIFTIEDVFQLHGKDVFDALNEAKESKKIGPRVLTDKKVRNLYWKTALPTYQWSNCPIGMLPWQMDLLEIIAPLNTTRSKSDGLALEAEITPGVLDIKDLKMQSQINWDKVLRKKRRLNRRSEQRKADIVNKALENVRKQK